MSTPELMHKKVYFKAAGLKFPNIFLFPVGKDDLQ